MLFAFLTGKTSNHYICLLDATKERCLKIGKNFNPSFVLSDYKKGFLSAISLCLLSATHYVYFHYTQAVYKQVQVFGLTRAYRFQESVRFFIRQSFCLPYLSKSLLVETFEQLIATTKYLIMISKYPKFQDHIDYVKRVWVYCYYPLQMWNIFERDYGLRTSNNAESWNSRWNQRMGRAHSNFWVCVQKLQIEERFTKKGLKSYNRGEDAPRGKRKWRRANSQFMALRKAYIDGNINLLPY